MLPVIARVQMQNGASRPHTHTLLAWHGSPTSAERLSSQSAVHDTWSPAKPLGYSCQCILKFGADDLDIDLSSFQPAWNKQVISVDVRACDLDGRRYEYTK